MINDKLGFYFEDSNWVSYFSKLNFHRKIKFRKIASPIIVYSTFNTLVINCCSPSKALTKYIPAGKLLKLALML